MLKVKNGIILIDFMDEFCRSMKPLQTLKNTGMGYSAAYPTGAERIVKVTPLPCGLSTMVLLYQ